MVGRSVRAVDVGARVSQYEVTCTPLLGAVGRGRLRLVWVRSTEPEVADTMEAAASSAAASAENAGLAVLDAYRITRVPERVLRVAS